MYSKDEVSPPACGNPAAFQESLGCLSFFHWFGTRQKIAWHKCRLPEAQASWTACAVSKLPHWAQSSHIQLEDLSKQGSSQRWEDLLMNRNHNGYLLFSNACSECMTTWGCEHDMSSRIQCYFTGILREKTLHAILLAQSTSENVQKQSMSRKNKHKSKKWEPLAPKFQKIKHFLN